MELFRTQRGGKEIGNFKFFDPIAKKNVDTGTSDMELARLKLPSASVASSADHSPSLASVAAVAETERPGQTPSSAPAINATVSISPQSTPTPNNAGNQPGGNPPLKEQTGLRKPESPQYTPAQIARLRDSYATMIAEADCDMLRLMFSMMGYTTPEIRPEDVAQIKLGWEMLAMEWFINGVPPAWLVLTLTHIKLISRMSLSAKPKERPKDDDNTTA
jgi:hypothetical protein